MKNISIETLRNILGVFLSDTTKYHNIVLPAKHLRPCGINYFTNKYYVKSAQNEAKRLATYFKLNKHTNLLDVGCGMGRLPIGIISTVGEIENYWGVDVVKRSIDWCVKNISSRYPSFKFKHINVNNPRYNPKGILINRRFKYPFDNSQFDIVYLYSVFSHMISGEIKIYMDEFYRILKPSGKIFITAFVEENVPKVTINPKNYKKPWRGPLHCVRYEKKYFMSLVNDSGFDLMDLEQGKEISGQSFIYLQKRKK